MAERPEALQQTGGGEPSELSPTLARHLESISAVFDAAPIAMAVWSMDGELVQANPVFCDLVRMAADELPGQRFESFIDPLEAAEIRAKVADIWTGRRNYFECDFRCSRPDGAEHWVRTMLTAVYGPTGQPDYLVSQVFDFANPRTREARTHRLVNQTPVMLWLTDEAGAPQIGNRTSFEFLGIEPDDADLASALLRSIHPDDLNDIADDIAASVAERVPFEFTARVARGDGDYRWLHHRALPFYDAEGDFEGYAGASLDVTEAEELRRELHEVRELFRTVTDAGPIAVLRTDRIGNIVYVNGGWPAILAGDHDQLVGLDWRTALEPEHVDEIERRGTASVGSRESFTVRVRTLGARAAMDEGAGLGPLQAWGELRVAPVFAGDHHDGFVATLADVSAEVAAGTRADRLARVLDAGSDFLMIAERNGAISYVNDAAQQTLGVEGSTTEGGAPSLLMDVFEPDSYQQFLDVVEPTLARDGFWRGELNFRSWTGSPIPVSALFIAHVSPVGDVESISAVARDITDLKDAERRLRELATHDYLTGLPNRVLLYDRLEQALARFQRHGQAVALLYLDLDRFKPVNDELGHQVGDAVLVEVADRIHTVIRDTDTAARIGGDEFAVLIEAVDDEAQLQLVADRLIEVIGQPLIIGEHRAEVGVSIGLVMAGAQAVAADSLMAAADAAMYRAKAAGRGGYEFVGPDGLSRA